MRSTTISGLSARMGVQAIAHRKLNARKEPNLPKLTLVLIVLVIREKLRQLEEQQKKT